ncbi:MAG: hypothetical protein VW082_00775 [Candidatus Nanopelagicales bacterium]
MTIQSATPNTVTWPDNDPATWRHLPMEYTPLDDERVQSLLSAEWDRFTAQTPGSGAQNPRAVVTLPRGVPTSLQ